MGSTLLTFAQSITVFEIVTKFKYSRSISAKHVEKFIIIITVTI